MSRVFSQLLQLGVFVAIIAFLLAVIARNMRKVFGTFWYSLASRARHGSIGTANGCSPTLGVGRLPAVLCCIMLLGLLDPIVVGLSLGFVLVK